MSRFAKTGKTDGELFLVEYEERGGRRHVIQEVPAIKDLTYVSQGNPQRGIRAERWNFEFDFDEERQAVTVEVDRMEFYIVNPSEWHWVGPIGRHNRDKWKGVPEEWHEIFDENFAEPEHVPNLQHTLWFGRHAPTRLIIYSREDIPLEEAADALKDYKMTGFFIDEEHEKELYKDAENEVKEEYPDLDPEDDEFRDRVMEQATADLTYTESGYIDSEEWGIDNWGDEFGMALSAAAYYISRLMYPTDEDLELQPAPDEYMEPL